MMLGIISACGTAGAHKERIGKGAGRGGSCFTAAFQFFCHFPVFKLVSQHNKGVRGTVPKRCVRKLGGDRTGDGPIPLKHMLCIGSVGVQENRIPVVCDRAGQELVVSAGFTDPVQQTFDLRHRAVRGRLTGREKRIEQAPEERSVFRRNGVGRIGCSGPGRREEKQEGTEHQAEERTACFFQHGRAPRVVGFADH